LLGTPSPSSQFTLTVTGNAFISAQQTQSNTVSIPVTVTSQ
jgi:hypothetical protein